MLPAPTAVVGFGTTFFRHNTLHTVPVVDLFLYGVIDKLLCLLVVKNHVLAVPVIILWSSMPTGS